MTREGPKRQLDRQGQKRAARVTAAVRCSDLVCRRRTRPDPCDDDRCVRRQGPRFRSTENGFEAPRAWQFRIVSGSTIQRPFNYRLYPTVGQVDRLEEQLSFNRRLYNAALEQRRSLVRSRRGHLLQRAGAAAHGAPPRGGGRTRRHELLGPTEALERLDLAFRAFFPRVKRGEAPGYPRFRAATRYDTII